MLSGMWRMCGVKAGRPDSQLRSEDESETAGDECMFSDGWMEGILQLL